MKTISVKQLQRIGACQESIDAFRGLFGEIATVTLNNVEKARGDQVLRYTFGVLFRAISKSAGDYEEGCYQFYRNTYYFGYARAEKVYCENLFDYLLHSRLRYPLDKTVTLQ